MVGTTARRIIRLAGGALLATALLGVPAVGPASSYPEQTCNVKLSSQAVRSGDALRVTGALLATDSAVAAGTAWTVSFAGQTVRHSGASFAHRFRAPNVRHETTKTVRVRARNGSTECQRTLEVRVSPDVQTPVAHGDLPNTGGPSRVLVVGGLMLLVSGALTVLRSRARG